jgi:chromosome segregation ATPase
VPVGEDESSQSASRAEQLQAEIERLQKEVLRLRDAVIGKDAELGEALGRMAEAQAQANKFAESHQRLEEVLASRSWRLTWAAGKPVRALRSRRTAE